jgi:membrane protease YdiL (CAAX protease family)
MLSAKPWRLEALIRLGLGVLLCFFMGALVMSGVRLGQGAAGDRLVLTLTIIVAGFSALIAALVLSRRPWDIERARMRLMIFLLCLYAGLTLVLVAQKLTHAPGGKSGLWQMVVVGISFQGAALALIGPFLREHQTTWSAGFGFGNDPRRAVLLGLLVAVAFLPLAWLLQMAMAALMSLLHIAADAQVAIQALQDAPTWVQRLPLGLVAVILAPPAEEMLFRGLLYPFIKRAGFPRLALWGTALFFAAVHSNLLSFVPLVLLALLLTWLYEKTDNLLAPIAAHGLFNALNFVALQFYDHAWTQPR